MKIVKLENEEEISKAVAKIIIDKINEKPTAVLGFATGASPIETYKKIINAYKKEEVSLKNISTFNLDEYVGLTRENENSYYYFMKENLFGKTDVDFSKVHFLSGIAEDCEKECENYKKQIETAGGIDIQLLGIGRNGHIGFNEPSTTFTDGPHKVKLTQSTIDANSKYFENDTMPSYALTMGVADILKAEKILLIATGTAKAQAIHDIAYGEISPACPASALRLHRDATIFVDKESAALL